MSGFMKGLINPDDKERDIKLLAFGATALVILGKLTVTEITSQWVNAFYGLCALVGLGGPAFAAVDKWRASAAPQPPASAPGPGTPDKEGS